MYYPPYQPYYKQPTSIKTILIITVVVIALLVGVYYYLKVQANNALKDELPSEYADETFTTAEGKTIRNYATLLQEDISPSFQVYHNQDLYDALLLESDRIFSGVAVDYKRLTGNSLRQDINDETSFSFTEGQADIKKRMLSRLSQLNIF